MTEVVSQTGFLAGLGIKGSLFAAQLINFLIILFIVWRYVYRPLLRTMDERSEKIAHGLRQAEEGKTALSEAQHAKRTLLKQAEKEAHELIDQARSEAQAQRQAMLAETRLEIERQIEQARAQLQEERAVTVQAVKADMAQLVLLATQRVLGQTSEANQTKLVEQALSTFEHTPKI